jgi:hypothetical protein
MIPPGIPIGVVSSMIMKQMLENTLDKDIMIGRHEYDEFIGNEPPEPIKTPEEAVVVGVISIVLLWMIYEFWTWLNNAPLL